MKRRYRLHWASGYGPRPTFRWAVYDWAPKRCCSVAYAETRTDARALCKFLNQRVLAGSTPTQETEK